MPNEVVDYHRSIYPDDPRTDDDLTLLAAEQAPIQELQQFPNYMADLSRIRQEQAVAGSSMLGELGSGLYRGTLGLGQAVTGGMSLLSGALGAEGAKQYYQEAYTNLARKAAEEAPASVPTIGGAFSSFPAAGQYLSGKIGEFIPAVGEAAAAGAIGTAVAPGPGTVAGAGESLFARAATKLALRNLVKKGMTAEMRAELEGYIAGEIPGAALSKGTAEVLGAAEHVAQASQFAGSTAATAGAFGAMGAGPTYAELSGRPGVSEPAAFGAAALAGAGGSLGALVSLPVLKQIFGQEVPSANYIDLFAKKIPAEILTAGGGMGAMEFLNIQAERWADPEKRNKPWGQEEYSKLLNSTIDGILMAAPHAIYAGIKGPEVPEAAKPAEPAAAEPGTTAAATPATPAAAAATPAAPVTPAPTITPGMTAQELITAYGMPADKADALRKLAAAEVSGQAGPADQAALLAITTSPADKAIYEALKQEVSNAIVTGQKQESVQQQRQGADGLVQGQAQDRDVQAAQQAGGTQAGAGHRIFQTEGELNAWWAEVSKAIDDKDEEKAKALIKQLPPIDPANAPALQNTIYSLTSPSRIGSMFIDRMETADGTPLAQWRNQLFQAKKADPLTAAAQSLPPDKLKILQAWGINTDALHTVPEEEPGAAPEQTPVEKAVAAAKERAVATTEPKTEPAPETDEQVAERLAPWGQTASVDFQKAQAEKTPGQLVSDGERIARALSHAYGTKGAIDIYSGKRPFPSLEEFKKATDQAYYYKGNDLAKEIEATAKKLGVDITLPKHTDFPDSRSYYLAMDAAESKLRASGAKMAAAMGLKVKPKPEPEPEPAQPAFLIRDKKTGETVENPAVDTLEKAKYAAGELSKMQTGHEGFEVIDKATGQVLHTTEAAKVEPTTTTEAKLVEGHRTADGYLVPFTPADLVEHADGQKSWLALASSDPATVEKEMYGAEIKGEKGVGIGRQNDKNQSKAAGVFEAPDGKIIVAQIYDNGGRKVSNSHEGGISWEEFTKEKGNKPIGHLRLDEPSKHLYAEYSKEQWADIQRQLEEKRSAAKAEIGATKTDEEAGTATTGTGEEIKGQVGGKVLEGKGEERVTEDRPSGKISEELAGRLHEAALELLPAGHLEGVPVGHLEARRVMQDVLLTKPELLKELVKVAGQEAAPQFISKMMGLYGDTIEHAEETGITDPAKLRDEVLKALTGLTAKKALEAPDDVRRTAQVPGERSAAQQEGSNPLDIAAHIQKRMADLGIPTHLLKVDMDSLVRQLRQPGGWSDRVDKAITLVMDDTTLPSNADIRALFEEAGHQLYGAESKELQDALSHAIRIMEDKKPEDFDIVRRRMAQAYGEGNLPTGKIESEELVMGYLSEKLSREGFNPIQASGIAANLMRLVKQAYLSGAMWLQRNVLGREYVNPDLMMRYWENRLEHWIAGTQGRSWMDWLGGSLPSFTKQISWHDASEGSKEMKEFYNPVTTLIDTTGNVSDSIEALILNLDGDRYRFTAQAPGAAPVRPVDPSIKYNREEAANNKVREVRDRIADLIAKPKNALDWMLGALNFAKLNGLHDVERKAEIIQAKAILDKALGFKKDQKIEDFAEGGESSGKAYKGAAQIIKNEMAQVQRNLTRDQEKLQQRIQEREDRLTRLDKFKDRYKDAQWMADLIKTGFRKLARSDIRELVRSGRVHGAIWQQLEDIAAAENRPINPIEINSLRKIYTGEGLHGDTLFNVLDKMANDPNIDFSQKASQIKNYVRSSAALQDPERGVTYLHLESDPALLAAAIGYGKMNRRVLNALQMRRMKGEERLAAEKELQDLKKESYDQLDTGIRKIGKSAGIRELAKNDYRRELRIITRMNRQMEHLGKRIDMNWRALPEYQAELDRIAAKTALTSPEDSVFSDGMVVKVPKSHERNTEWEHQTINLDSTKGPVTDVKPILEKFSAYTMMREQEAKNGDDTALGMDYNRTKAAEREILYSKVLDPAVRNADGFTTGLVLGNVATALESIGTPQARLIGQMIRQYASDKQTILNQADARFGDRVTGAEHQVMSEINRGRKASGRVDQDWFDIQFRNAVMGFSEKFQSTEGKDREANKAAHMKALGDWLLSQPMFANYIKDRMPTFMPRLEKMLDVNYEAGQYFQKILEEKDLLVKDPQLDLLRKSIPVGLYTFPRKFSPLFSAMVHAMRLSGWGTTGINKETGKREKAAVFGDFAKVADTYRAGGAAEVNKLVDKYVNNPVYGGTTRDAFLFKLFHPVDESVLDSPAMDESGLTTKIDPLTTAKAYDEANGDLTVALEKIYDEIKAAGNESKADFIQKSYLRLAEVYDDMNRALQDIEPGSTADVRSLVNLIPNAMIDARAFEHLPGEWFDYHKFDRNGNARMAERMAAQINFGRNGRRLAELHQGLTNETNVMVSKIDSIRKQAQAEVPSGNKKAVEKRMLELVALDKGPELSGFKTAKERLQYLQRVEDRSPFVEKFVGQMTDYVHRHNQQEGSVRWGIRAAQELAQLMVNKMTTAVGQLATIFDIPIQWGVSPATLAMTGKVGLYTAKDIAGSLVESLGFKFLRLNEDEARANAMKLNDAALSRKMGDIFQRLEGEAKGAKFFRVAADIQQHPFYLPELAKTVLGRSTEGVGEGRQYTGFRPLAPFSQTVISVNRAITVAINQLAKAYVTRGIEFLEKNPTAEKITAEDIFTKGALKGLDRDSFNRWQKSINNYGLDFTDMVRGAIKRKNSGEKTILSDKEFSRMYSIGLSDLSQEANIATMPLWAFNNAGARFALPLMGWSYRRALQVGEQLGGLGAGDKRKLSALGTSLLGLGITGLGGLAVSMLQDDFQEEVLGKKRNLRDARIPMTGNDWIALNERMNRVGTLGLWGEALNSALNVGTGQGDNRDLSFDNRVVALQSIQAIKRVISNWVNQDFDANYASVVRPAIEAIGGDGLLQYMQVVNHTFDLDNVESRVVRRINAANYLRVVGRDLELPVRTGGGGYATPTAVTPWISRMEHAAYGNDPSDFRAAYRGALQASKEAGKEDPADYVKKAFETHHPLRFVFSQALSDQEYRQILANLNDEGRADVTEAVRLFNHYGEFLGLQPYQGKKAKAPSVTSTIQNAQLRALLR